MTLPTSTGTHGKSTWDTEKTERSNIRSAKNISNCGCGKGRVLIEFYNGHQFVTHDDGSFWQWTGGQNIDEHGRSIDGKAGVA